MKKSILLLIILSIYSSVFSQLVLNEETGKYKFEKVIQAEGVSADEIFERAKTWTLRTLKSSDSNVGFDKENNQIISTGNFLLNNRGLHTNGNLNFKVSIFNKEGRYKVIIDNFFYYYLYTFGEVSSEYQGGLKKLHFRKKNKAKTLLEIEGKLTSMIIDLESTIKSGKSPNDSNDDW